MKELPPEEDYEPHPREHHDDNEPPRAPVRRLRSKTAPDQIQFRDSEEPEPLTKRAKTFDTPEERQYRELELPTDGEQYEPTTPGDDLIEEVMEPEALTGTSTRTRSAPEGISDEQRPSKRLRTEMLEILLAKIDKLAENRKRKEVRLNNMSSTEKDKF